MLRSWRERIKYTTHEGFGSLDLKITWRTVLGLSLKTQVEFKRELEAARGRHQGVRIDTNLSHEKFVAVGSTNLELGDNAPGVKWFNSNYLGTS